MGNITDVHVGLPPGLLAQLDDVAQKRGVRRTRLVREAIAEYLGRIETEQVGQQMRLYADKLAAYSGEFVGESDAHVSEQLIDTTEW